MVENLVSVGWTINVMGRVHRLIAKGSSGVLYESDMIAELHSEAGCCLYAGVG